MDKMTAEQHLECIRDHLSTYCPDTGHLLSLDCEKSFDALRQALSQRVPEVNYIDVFNGDAPIPAPGEPLLSAKDAEILKIAHLRADAERYQQLRDIIDDGSESANHADAVVFCQAAKEDQAEIARLRADAERYRFIRGQFGFNRWGIFLPCGPARNKESLAAETDAEIDAARLSNGDNQ